MSFRGDHRISAVGMALTRRARMDVNVGDDRQPGFAAKLPKRSVTAAVENDDAGFKRARIEVIIISESGDSAPRAVFRAEQERAAFVIAFRAPAQLRESFIPQPRRTTESVSRSCEAPYSLLN